MIDSSGSCGAGDVEWFCYVGENLLAFSNECEEECCAFMLERDILLASATPIDCEMDSAI